MKILLSFLFVALLGTFSITKAVARQAHVTGSINAVNNGIPCVLHYDITIDYSIGFGITVNGISGSLSGCGISLSFSPVAPTYNNGNGWNNNGSNLITNVTFQQADQATLDYLNSGNVQTALCNEINNIIVPQCQ